MVFCIAAISLNASLAKYEAPPLPISAAALRRFKGLAFCLDRDIVWYTDISFILPKLYPNSDICGNAPNLLCIAFYMQGILLPAFKTRFSRYSDTITAPQGERHQTKRKIPIFRYGLKFNSSFSIFHKQNQKVYRTYQY